MEILVIFMPQLMKDFHISEKAVKFRLEEFDFYNEEVVNQLCEI